MQPDRIWIWFAENGNIRKWQRDPFLEGAEYTALQAPQEAGVGVKALEWDVDGRRATCAFGVYTVSRTADGYSAAFGDDELVHVGFNAVDVFYGAKRTAQDHAQADFEARIRSALSQPVATPAPSQDAAVDGEPTAFLIERLAGAGYGSPRSIVDAAKYDPRRDDFWVGDAKTRHLVTPLYAATRPAEAQAVTEGWRDMASAPKDGTRILLKVVTFAWSSDVCQHVATGDQAIEARWATWMNGDSDGAWHKWCGNARTFSTDGALVPLGWLPLPAASPATGGA